MQNVLLASAVLFLILSFALQAQAYLDPGSGSMLLQLLLGGVAGVLLAIKIFWRQIQAKLGIGRKDEKGKQSTDGTP